MCGIATLTIVMSSTSRMAVSTTATTKATEGCFLASCSMGASSGGCRRFNLDTRRFIRFVDCPGGDMQDTLSVFARRGECERLTYCAGYCTSKFQIEALLLKL